MSSAISIVLNHVMSSAISIAYFYSEYRRSIANPRSWLETSMCRMHDDEGQPCFDKHKVEGNGKISKL
jgi:hypothetical protein